MTYEVISICGLLFSLLAMIIGITALILSLATRWSTHKMEFIPVDEHDVQDQKTMNKLLNGIEEDEEYDSI